jgi:hypothetical protein
MNRPVHNARARGTRNASPTLAPVARAIRLALAASATALALSAPLVATAADPCVSAQDCRADFRQAVAAHAPLPVDLTVVADAPAPTAVTNALHGGHATVDTVAFAGTGMLFAPTATHDLVDDLTRVDALPVLARSFATTQRGDIGLAPALDNALDIVVEGDGNITGLDLHDPTALDFHDAGSVAAIAHIDAYGAARATGVFAMAPAVAVDNTGAIHAYADADGGYARARAVETFAYGTGSTVHNDGVITARAVAADGTARAFGVYSFGYSSDSAVGNAGDVLATAQADGGRAYATAVNSTGYGGDAIVDNTGTLAAQASGASAYAFGVMNLATRQDGVAQVDNDGAIDVDATGDYATASGIVNAMFRYAGASVTNAGSIAATATGTAGASATGIYNYAYIADAVVDSGGSIDALATATTGPALATGIYNHSGQVAETHNSGAITITATTQADLAGAWGMIGLAGDTAYVVNDGDIAVIASNVGGDALAAGIYASAPGLASVTNHGSVSTTAGTADGDASAYGALVAAGFTGIGMLVNGGDIDASATVAGSGNASAIAAYVFAEVASVFNDASASASANTADGTAIARGLGAYGAYSAVANYGDVVATAAAGAGAATAIGADSWGYLGASSSNDGAIAATASAAGGTANATGASTIAYIFSAYTDNTGTIAAHADGDYATATGVLNAAQYLGTATTTNDGSIVAIAEGVMAAVAVGAYNFAYLYDSVVDNRGSIDATAVTSYYQASAVGAQAVGAYGYGDAIVANTGSIDAFAAAIDVPGFGSASAWGVVTQNGPTGLSEIRNDGAITATAYATADFNVANATGAYAQSLAGTASIVNHGDVVAVGESASGRGYSYVTGAQVLALYGGSVGTLDNQGSIAASASVFSGFAYATGAQAYGYDALIANAAGADIAAIAHVEQFGGAVAIGIDGGAKYDIHIVNDGDITAYAHSEHGWVDPDTGDMHISTAGATGILAYSGNFFTEGDASVTNHGDITAVAIAEDNLSFFNGLAGATGIRVIATRDALLDNGGQVTAIAQADLGNVAAYGVVADGRHRSAIVNEAGAVVFASATTGSNATDYNAGRAAAFGAEVFGAAYASIDNAGSITAQAIVHADGPNPSPAIGVAFGVELRSFNTGEVVNSGDVHAFAQADFGYASAYGVRLPGNRISTYSSNLLATIDNSGLITARAEAAHGNAFAVGAYAYALAQEYLGCDETGCHYDIVGGDVAITNSGDIQAVANADGGIGASQGIAAIAAYSASVTNTGDVSAVTHADEAVAIGVLASSLYSDATVANSGQIVAAAYGSDATSIGVQLLGSGANSLVNTGVIAALGDGARIAVQSSSDATASIANFGALTGAILTGNLADQLDNGAGALWHAVGDSDFGAGADQVANAGTIVLDNATISLGAAGEGDTFTSTGLVAVSGNNTIELPGASFTNDGVVSFLDGAADDRLTILGDFAGDGAIQLDVSGLAQASDRLYVDGNVVAGTAQVLDVNLRSAPTSASTLIPLLFVSGDSTAANFALGNVAFGGNDFLALDFHLDAAIDASNATDDVFSLGVTVTGLNDAGALAAVFAPGVQGLVDAQVGNWRQRMGVVRGPRAGVLEPWLRMFSDGGDFAPTHAGNFGGGGDLGYHQSNHGWELGLETRPSGHFALGMLIAASQGSQQLDAGAGRADLDAQTLGVFGTWVVGGFHLDASQRWIGVDARLESGAGALRTEANAKAFNLEAGYTAWTLGGVHVVPQAQYTHSRVGDLGDLHGGSSTFVDAGGLSSRVRLGVAFDCTFDGARFAWTPFGAIDAVRELDGDYEHAINGGLRGTTSTDGTSTQVELGLDARKGRFSVTGSVHWVDGGAIDGLTGGQLTVRYRW